MDGVNEELVISWRNISTWVKTGISKNPRKLLSDVSGIAKSGRVMAVLSPSGAGKTTLLATLSGRFRGKIDGDMFLNGERTTQNQMSRLCGLVPQTDFVFGALTVEEHLKFMARLKMDRSLSSQQRSEIVLKTSEQLGLADRLSVRLQNLSGGQKKRLALAVQLLTNPKILLCDEPTTGLDSFGAMNVIKLLCNLANKNKLIICAIHQPTPRIFEMFDAVTLLTSGGSLAYFGPVREVLQYFQSVGLDCPLDYSVSEFLVSQVTVHSSQKFEDGTEDTKVQHLVRCFKNSLPYQRLVEELSNASNQKLPNVLPILSANKIERVSFCVEFGWLLWRSTILIVRNYQTVLLRLLLYSVVMLVISSTYGRVEINQIGIQNIQGLLHMSMLEIMYSCFYSIMMVFPEEMSTFLQESSDYVYTPAAYYISNAVIFAARVSVESFFLANIVFLVTGLFTGHVSFIYPLPIVLLAATSTAYGSFLSTAFESVTTSSLFSVPFELICCIYGGIFVRLRSLPWYTQWMKYFSFIYYAYEALTIQQWTLYKHIPCDREVCYSSGREVLRLYGFKQENLAYDYLGLLMMFAVFHTLGFILLLRRRIHAVPY